MVVQNDRLAKKNIYQNTKQQKSKQHDGSVEKSNKTMRGVALGRMLWSLCQKPPEPRVRVAV